MNLGLGKNEVRLVPHNKGWTNEFNLVKDRLVKQTLLEEHQVKHIGSTAIKDIIAKPIVDILVGIESIQEDTSLLEKELRTCGFYRLQVERSGEIVFAKFTDKTFKVKTHFIHLTDLDGALWKNFLFFRDYLNEYRDARSEYEAIKLNYVKNKNEGVIDYTDAKEDFVRMILFKKDAF